LDARIRYGRKAEQEVRSNQWRRDYCTPDGIGLNNTVNVLAALGGAVDTRANINALTKPVLNPRGNVAITQSLYPERGIGNDGPGLGGRGIDLNGGILQLNPAVATPPLVAHPQAPQGMGPLLPADQALATKSMMVRPSQVAPELLIRQSTAEIVGPPASLAPNKWIGSKLSPEATQEAADSMARRISSLRAGRDEAFEEVALVGSRKTGWSETKNRPPLSTSDVDIAINDWAWFKGSRNEAKVLQKVRGIADEFEANTGLKVELHLRSRYSKEQWAQYFGNYFKKKE
jgi:hypothetical protein